jgi:dihydrofolate synthase/folylpolyglutamate synthase
MNYQESLEFIHGIERFGSKPGLERVKLLLERLGNPQKKLRFVHAAGTKGKGSTCAMLSGILKQAGFKTGLYISPFVLDFRERVQINGEMIPEDALAEAATRVRPHWEALDSIGETPSEFEVVVAAAMDYFARENCDIVVLEVGMGGRLDATNAIDTPLCAVITSLGFDHTEYLGETIERIAYEKCGIIKPGGATVSAAGQPREAAAVIANACFGRGSRLIVCGEPEILRADITGSDIRYRGLELFVPLGGAHQAANAANAIEAALALRNEGLAIADSDIIAGIGATAFPARLEVLSREPLVLLDGAHNPMSAEALARALKPLEGLGIHAICGIMADKDISGVLGRVLPLCASLVAVKPSNPRAMPAEKLAMLAGECLQDAETAESMEQAVRMALEKAKGGGAVLIFGSLYLAAEIRPVAMGMLGQALQ